jgi:hypothetical protein
MNVTVTVKNRRTRRRHRHRHLSLPGDIMRNTKFKIRVEGPADSGPQAPLELTRGEDGRLSAHLAGESRIVRVQRCFPWSEPGHFISLREDDGEEFALVADPAELSSAARAALETALLEAGFIFDIEAVMGIEEEVELRDWRVQTNQGPRRFQTRLDDWPRRLPDGGILIRDVTGDFYRVADPARLDRKSRALLWAFVD